MVAVSYTNAVGVDYQWRIAYWLLRRESKFSIDHPRHSTHQMGNFFTHASLFPSNKSITFFSRGEESKNKTSVEMQRACWSLSVGSCRGDQQDAAFGLSFRLSRFFSFR